MFKIFITFVINLTHWDIVTIVLLCRIEFWELGFIHGIRSTFN